MQRVTLVLLGLIVLIAAVLAASPRARDELQWRWTSYQDQPGDYAGYLASWPDGRHTTKARELYDERSWADAKSSATAQAFEAYLSLHPQGRYAADAHAGVENLRWERTRKVNTAVSYQRYLDAYPSGRFAAEAKRKKTALLQDDAPYLAAKKQGSREAYETFLTQFPGHQRQRDVESALKDMAGRDIVDLLAQRKVEARTRGSGIESVHLEVRRRVDHEITVLVPVGTFFVSHRASAQNMVATKEETITLRDNEWRSVSVSAACANRPRDVPKSEDSFQIERAPGQKELQKLMPVLRKANADNAVQQAAVWIVTDDANFADLGVLVSSTGPASFGGTRVINEHEAALAMKICEEAGIAITRKAIWRDRDQIIRALEDKNLKTWLQRRANK